jgi:hypothetical protein
MPRRHRKGEGSLRYRKDLGMYEIRLTIGGKRKSFYSPGPRTRENEKRADLLRRKLALAYGITPNNPDNPPTLLEWLEAHAEAARAEGRRPTPSTATPATSASSPNTSGTPGWTR